MIQPSKEIDLGLLLKDLRHECLGCTSQKESRVINCSTTFCPIHKWRKYFIDFDQVLEVEKVKIKKDDPTPEELKKVRKKRKVAKDV